MNQADGMKTLLFHRDYRSFTGGHLKVYHYFLHAQESAKFQPRIYFTPNSVRGPGNPWHAISPPPLEDWRPAEAAVLFLAGLDWLALTVPAPVPVINLIQSFRHADPGDARRSYLAWPAVRVCVSQEVADAIESTGIVNGPVHVIPNGIDLGRIPTAPVRDIEVLVAGIKNPALAVAVAARLRGSGLNVTVVTALLPRAQFLELLSRARVAVMLPRKSEGFYLPALEAMAAEAIVVCPDCTGNRGFCRDGETAFMPAYSLDEIVAAAIAASGQPERARCIMLRAAAAESRRHGLDAERAAFLHILDGV
jgi:hypothetical protein